MITTRTLFVLMMLAASQVRAECLPSGRPTFAAGLEALSRGDLQTAFARFEELVKEQPDCTEARNNLAVVLFEMGLPEEADKQLRQAVELNPDYQRARFNLRKVEGSFHGQTAPPEIETAMTEEERATPSAAPTVVPTTARTVVPPATASHPTPAPTTAAAQAAAPLVPPNLAALEPQGATACVLDAGRRQLCVYRRAQSGIVPDACYPILSVQVPAWPQWVTASDHTTKRIRLVDDPHHRRLRVVPEGVEMDDSVRVRQRDFDTLASKVTPWRSGWVVLGPGTPSLAAAAAAQAAQQVGDALEHWRQAWEGKKLDAYLSFYGPSFVPQPEGDVARWRARKQGLFAQSGAIAVGIASPSVFVLGDGSSVLTVFEQSYRSGAVESHDLKALRWQRQGERWLISVETTLAEKAHPPRAHRRRGG